MSDLTDLFAGKFGNDPLTAVEGFVEKEWGNALHLYANLPADLKPLADVAVADAKAVMVTAAQWGGTAVSAYISANGANLQTEILNLISGAMGGSNPTSIAAQDTVAAIQALMQGLVTHGVMSFVSSVSPPQSK